jgi:hypothetical protein
MLYLIVPNPPFTRRSSHRKEERLACPSTKSDAPPESEHSANGAVSFRSQPPSAGLRRPPDTPSMPLIDCLLPHYLPRKCCSLHCPMTKKSNGLRIANQTGRGSLYLPRSGCSPLYCLARTLDQIKRLGIPLLHHCLSIHHPMHIRLPHHDESLRPLAGNLPQYKWRMESV